MALAQAPSAGLVAYYPFNGNANDETGTGHNGLVNGASVTADRFGNASKAYSFDGVDDRIEVAHKADLNSLNFTYSIWVNINEYGTSTLDETRIASMLMAKYGGSQGFVIFNNLPGQLVLRPTPSTVLPASNDYFTNQSIPVNTWKQVVFTKSGQQIRSYVDGVLSSTGVYTGNYTPSPESLYIGSGPWRSDEFFRGKLDDIRIYNRALSETEVTQLYTSESTQATCASAAFSFTVSSSNTAVISNASPTATTLTFCNGGQMVVGMLTADVPTANLRFIERMNSDGNVAFDGLPVPAQRAQTDVGIEYFNRSYGAYTLLNPNITGTLSETFTPYIDLNNDRRFNPGTECLGQPALFIYDIKKSTPPTLFASSLVSNQPISVTATGCSGSLNWTPVGGIGQANGNIYTFSQPGSYSLSATCSQGSCTGLPSNTLSLQIQTGNFAISSVNTIQCQPIDARQLGYQVRFTPVYSGTNASPVSFSVTKEMLPTTSSGPYSLTLYIDNPSVVMVAKQSGSPEARYVYNWLAACQTSGFSIVGVSTVSCEVLRSDQRRLTFTPQYSGVNGSPISFSAVNEILPTTAAGPYRLDLFTDNPVINLRAQQSGVQTSYAYNWLQACPASGRVGASEAGTGLQVKVLGNPVQTQSLELEISGVEGQRVNLELVDLGGQRLQDQHLEQAGVLDRVKLNIGSKPGVFLLQVSTATQRQVIRVVKP
ncbi:LamG-like jellyroll fold domain-containing protein [Spirosoma flavus]